MPPARDAARPREKICPPPPRANAATAAALAHDGLRAHLDALAAAYETPAFIAADPVCIPHAYPDPRDREIAALVAAVFAWGQRPTILAKARDFLGRMGDSPYAFVTEHAPADRGAFGDFVHRTFQPADADYFLRRLQRHYRAHESLESLFADGARDGEEDVGPALRRFHERFFDDPAAPQRTRKHIATPARGSTCKRLCMLLRWMVRPAAGGVDFGLWHRLRPEQLVIPIDVHVRRQAEALGLLTRPQNDWRAAVELTGRLRAFDPADPVKYDFALFGEGALRARDGGSGLA